MLPSLDECVSRVGDESQPAKVFIMLGAGSGYSQRVSKQLRLPLGSEVRDALLAKAYPDSTLSADERLRQFQDAYGGPTTPDFVWQHLIKEPGRLNTYHPTLVKLFGPARPIPSAYYMVARWFFTAPNVGGLATTNFDEKLDAAVQAVAANLDQRLARDYHIPSVDQDFGYMLQSGEPVNRLIQKLHGTLSKPWSIVAGVPADEAGALDSRRFSSRDSYEMLGRGLAGSLYWVSTGFSFADEAIGDVFIKAFEERPGACLYIFEPSGNHTTIDQFITRCKKANLRREVHLIRANAEDFLQRVLTRLERSRAAPSLALPPDERRVLVDGPKHLPAQHRRVTFANASPFDDPVYGQYSFSDPVKSSLMAIIDCGELQRLRYIKQLSFVHLKHVGATHDRFAHTLGVTHLADRLVLALNSAKVDGPAAVDRESHLAFTVAALLHDTGHGPLGHTMDLVRRRLGRVGGHEEDSIGIFATATKGRSFADLEMALGNIGVRQNLVRDILKGKHSLSPALSNPGLDIDRLDFLLRDGLATVCSLRGRAAVERAASLVHSLADQLDFLLGGIVLGRGAGGTPLIGLRQDRREVAREAAELYAFMYREVYHCWQNCAAQVMVATAIEEVIRSSRFAWSDLIRLTDIELFTALEEFQNPLVRELAYLVKYRRLLDYIGELEFTGVFDAREGTIGQALGVEVLRAERLGGGTLNPDNSVGVMILPPKRFAVRFARADDMFRTEELGEEENLTIIPGRVKLFRWPGSRIGFESLVDPLRELLEASGCQTGSWVNHDSE